MVYEVNLVENNSEWITDTGASCHFCANKDLFMEFQKVDVVLTKKKMVGANKVYMGNDSKYEVLGKGKFS